MNFDDYCPDGVPDRLRLTLIEVFEAVYDDNSARFDLEQWDTPKAFGLTTSENVAQALSEETAAMPGVTPHFSEGTFFLRLDNDVEVYVCKAPPGTTSAETMRFDSSQIRKRIAKRNGAQLRIDLVNGTSTPVEDGRAPYLVVVHFGDSETGFSHAIVGVPYELANGMTGWEWYEPLNRPTTATQPQAGEDFGLTLRAVPDLIDDRDEISEDEPVVELPAAEADDDLRLELREEDERADDKTDDQA